MVERRDGPHREVARALATYTGRAHVVGLTGAPGVGKSTTTSALVGCLRERGERVGVLAVDPSSPFTGGALLGDRIRMQEHATDRGVYVRSMASRGHLGGLAVATPAAIRVLDAAGCDTVIVETVGVGQSEVEVAGSADTVVVLLAPGTGDAIQVAKAGVLEVGDVYVVNKADRDGADARRARPPADAGRRRGGAERLGATDRADLGHLRHRGRRAGRGDRRAPGLGGSLRRGAAPQGGPGGRGDRGARRSPGCGRNWLPSGRATTADLADRLALEVATGTLDPWSAADQLLAKGA